MEQTAAGLMTLFNRFGTLDEATPPHEQTNTDEEVKAATPPVLDVSRDQIIERLRAGIKRAIAEESVRAGPGPSTPARPLQRPGLSAYQVQGTLDTWDSLLTSKDADVQRIIHAVVFKDHPIGADTLVTTLCAQLLCLCKDFLDNIYWHTCTAETSAAPSVVVLHGSICALLKVIANSSDLKANGAVLCCERANSIRVAAKDLSTEAHDVVLHGFDARHLHADTLRATIGFSAVMPGEVTWNERVLVERILYHTKQDLVAASTPLETMQHTPDFNRFLRKGDLAHGAWVNKIPVVTSLLPLSVVDDRFIPSLRYLHRLKHAHVDEEMGHALEKHISLCTSALKDHITGLRDVAFSEPKSLNVSGADATSSMKVELMFNSLSPSKCVHTEIVFRGKRVAIIVLDEQKFRIPTKQQRDNWEKRTVNKIDLEKILQLNEHIFQRG